MKQFLSGFLKLNVKDFVKGLIIAVLAAVLQVILDTVSQGTLTFDWAAIGKLALSAAGVYLTKNLFTNSKGEFLTKEKQ